MARAVTEGRKWRQAPKSTKRIGKESFGKALNNISRLVADVLFPAMLNSCLQLSKPCSRLWDQQHGVQQRLCWQTVVQRPPNVGGSCKEEEKKPKCLRLPKEERRAPGEGERLCDQGTVPISQRALLGHWENPSGPLTSRLKCWIFYHQDLVALVFDLILAQRTSIVYRALGMCLASEEDSKAQAHTLFWK